MKRTLAVAAALIVGLTGCSHEPDGNFPEPKRSPSPTTSLSPSPQLTNTTGAPEPVPTTTKPKPEETTPPPNTPEEPAPATSTAAKTPAVEFAERWGKKYPAVQEFAILKAANGVCKVTEQFPDWTNNPIAEAGIAEIVKGFGIAENDGVEFTQDAQQNYCPSVSNPT